LRWYQRELVDDEEWIPEEIRQQAFDKIFVDHEVHDLGSGPRQSASAKHPRYGRGRAGDE
jgi:hypothetical protein